MRGIIGGGFGRNDDEKQVWMDFDVLLTEVIVRALDHLNSFPLI